MRDKRHVALCFFLAFVISITYAFCAERETSSQEPKDITQLRILYELPIPEPVDTDIIEEVEQVEEEIIEPTQPLYTAQEFKYNGVIWYNGLKWTWYSQKVLPGGGLQIPGRYVNEDGYVCDENGYICIASCDYKKHTVIETPLGLNACVYDYCHTSGVIDVYTNW